MLYTTHITVAEVTFITSHGVTRTNLFVFYNILLLRLSLISVLYERYQTEHLYNMPFFLIDIFWQITILCVHPLCLSCTMYV